MTVTAATVMIMIVLAVAAVVAAVVATVLASRTCNTYFIIIALEGNDLLIDLNEFPHCRHSSNEVTPETLGGVSNNSGPHRVIITGLALCR
jgi:hypothetical protein